MFRTIELTALIGGWRDTDRVRICRGAAVIGGARSGARDPNPISLGENATRGVEVGGEDGAGWGAC